MTRLCADCGIPAWQACICYGPEAERIAAQERAEERGDERDDYLAALAPDECVDDRGAAA